MLPTVMGATKALPVLSAAEGLERPTLFKRYRCAKRLVWTTVVHVVTLNAFVHDAEAAADDGLVIAGQIVSKADARAEVVSNNSSPCHSECHSSGDPDAVQIELRPRQSRIRD